MFFPTSSAHTAGSTRLIASFFAASIVIGTVAAHATNSWTTLGSGLDADVFDLTADGKGGVFAGGQFITAGGQSANGIAHWNGATWSALGSGVSKFGSSANVSAVEIIGDDVYAGGAFDRAGLLSHTNGIARWNGSAWSALAGGDISGSVFDLAHSGSTLYAGGNFTAAGGVTTSHIAQWDGSTWSALGAPGSGANAVVDVVEVAPNGDLFIGGIFTDVGGVAVSSIARWNGSTWSDVGGGVSDLDPSTTPRVFSLAFDAAGNLYVGGTFNQVGTGLLPVNNIAKWDGSTWSALGTGLDGTVNDLVLDSSGRLYATYYGNASSTGDIDRWDGARWTTLHSAANSSINSLAFTTPTKLLAGGAFTEIGGQVASFIAAFTIPVTPMPDGPTAPVQQFGAPEGTAPADCASLAPDSVDWPALVSLRSVGWSVSYAQWPRNGSGGWVCSRQPIYTETGWAFN